MTVLDRGLWRNGTEKWFKQKQQKITKEADIPANVCTRGSALTARRQVDQVYAVLGADQQQACWANQNDTCQRN